MLIKAAINGGRKRSEHVAVPVPPDEQASAVAQCLEAGTNAIHLHVRANSDPESFRPKDEAPHSKEESQRSENESLYAEDVARTLLAVRSGSPKAQIGVSTGAWILPNPALRFQAVAAWKVFPDFASVNFSEDGATELAHLLLSRGVDVEAGLCDEKAAVVFVRSGLAARCLRVLLEPQEQELAKALETVSKIETVLETASVELPRLLHGTEATAWPILDAAIVRGYDVRIGFEDTLVMPDGSVARNNAQLVAEAVERISDFRFRIAKQ